MMQRTGTYSVGPEQCTRKSFEPRPGRENSSLKTEWIIDWRSSVPRNAGMRKIRGSLIYRRGAGLIPIKTVRSHGWRRGPHSNAATRLGNVRAPHVSRIASDTLTEISGQDGVG